MDERFNQTLQNMLIKYIDPKKNLWAQFLDTCIFAYNTSAHESTKFSPFELMFGRKAVLPIDINMGNSAILEEFNHCQELSPSNVQEATELKNTVLEEAKPTSLLLNCDKRSIMIGNTANQVMIKVVIYLVLKI